MKITLENVWIRRFTSVPPLSTGLTGSSPSPRWASTGTLQSAEPSTLSTAGATRTPKSSASARGVCRPSLCFLFSSTPKSIILTTEWYHAPSIFQRYLMLPSTLTKSSSTTVSSSDTSSRWVASASSTSSSCAGCSSLDQRIPRGRNRKGCECPALF